MQRYPSWVSGQHAINHRLKAYPSSKTYSMRSRTLPETDKCERPAYYDWGQRPCPSPPLPNNWSYILGLGRHGKATPPPIVFPIDGITTKFVPKNYSTCREFTTRDRPGVIRMGVSGYQTPLTFLFFYPCGRRGMMRCLSCSKMRSTGNAASMTWKAYSSII